ncbi:Fatty acid synthase [Ooceraea biroi]|uniref:Fatty acid synthase n=1 Tax=Ooceraea biroi TaxID=2015173 RepID=A0A026WJ26_OOCBI|nr:Fatty acid synthase [Ooceraea biroi]
MIIKVQEEDNFVNAPILALPRYYCPVKKTYVILSGLGGFGLELADWLVIRGARNLVLISRSGIKNGYQHRKIELWKSYGVNVSIMSNIDASNANECEHINQCTHEYVSNISENVQQLKEINFVVQDEMVGALLLSGLPEEFRPMIMGLESSRIVMSSDIVKAKLLQECDKIEGNSKEMAFSSKNRNGTYKGERNRKCYNWQTRSYRC